MAENLELKQIQQYLGRDCELVLFETTDSTNDQARLKVKQGCQLPLACFAEEQTQGRGRRGKVWVSPPGSSVYLSLAWKFQLPVNELGCLSLAIGVAVARLLKKIGIAQVGLKWPNDVLVDDRKIAGILVEVTKVKIEPVAAVETTAIIGVGLNYKLPDDLLEADQLWTDIDSSLGGLSCNGLNVGRSKIAGMLLCECMDVCVAFMSAKRELMKEYQDEYDICLQQVVNVCLDDGQCMQGLVVGFDESGQIRIQIDNEERLFNSADISLRKASNVND